MAKSKSKERCFIIMPITTPVDLAEKYKGDEDHFTHVLDHLFIPALEAAGFDPISPKSKGSDVIQAEIIKRLSECELVLCDMSILNPNVFFEFGIRTALDMPVALVVDDVTKAIPFDTSILNFHKYGSLEVHTVEKERQALAKHVQDAYQKSKDRNALWKYFGVAQAGKYEPEDADVGEKMELVLKKLSAFEEERRARPFPDVSRARYPSPDSRSGRFGRSNMAYRAHVLEGVKDKILRGIAADEILSHVWRYNQEASHDSVITDADIKDMFDVYGEFARHRVDSPEEPNPDNS